MLFKNITILDENLDVKKNMYVGTTGEKITYISSEEPKAQDGNFGETYDGKGKLLMSGFYNIHAHSPMTLLRGYGEGLALQDWLTKKVFPFEDKLTPSAVYWGTLLAMAESIRFGIVSTSDMYYFCDDMARAIDESGAKDNIARGITNFSGTPFWDMTAAKEMKQLFETHDGSAGGRIKVDVSLHAEYTNDEQTARGIAEYAKEVGTSVHVHVSETKKEHEECKARHGGMTPVQFLNSTGLFDTPSIAAHCVWLEGEDFDILKEKNVTVASNPISNLKLASGVCNVPELLRRGINVGIGTDGPSSNNSLNFIEEMKVFAIASKERYGDPTAITTKEAIFAATAAGAKAQRRDDCGSLKKGNRADLIVIDLNQPHMHPVHDLTYNLVYSASGSDVVLTMSDGKVLYQNGEFKTIDLEKAVFEAERETAKILSQL
ncbi:MAG: amidohydrolase [Clostridia bacterium]|nr:amidohydrolase [Clostridia bacterium]